MCGIAGIVNSGGLDGSARSRVSRMVEALRHRGPDGSGVEEIGSRAVLGHARLAIVDLAGGVQPMSSRDGRLSVTFNGEIYGYRALRAATEYDYTTESDTELLLAMYAKSGPAMVRGLPGMFAFALWNEREQSLFCARDRFGEKPFYYALTPRGDFLFASEIKSLLASGLVDPVLSMEAVTHYLQKSYVHPHQTIYANVSVLPPGHCLVFRDGKVVVEKYWSFPKQRGPISLDEAGEELGRLLRAAVAKQLVADVPVSGFLSSGLDSTTIMAIAAEQNSDLTAISFDFEDSASEADIAERSAERYGLNFRRVRVGGFDPVEVLRKTISIYDEPFADSSSIPTYLISKAAAEFTKVALTGDGGDELLGGYDFQYQALLRFDEAKRWGGNRGMVYLAAKILAKLRLKAASQRMSDLGDKIPFFWGCREHWEVLAGMRSTCSFNGLQRFMEPSAAGPTGGHPPPTFERQGPMEDALLYDTETYMAGQILVKTDRASMANGLELRAPFLDVDFAEFAMSLPAALKVSRTSSKIVLRHAFTSVWNEEVARNYKRGFGSPIEKWLQTPAFRGLVDDFLVRPDRKIHEVLPRASSADLRHLSAPLTYNLLVLSLWMEQNSYSLPGAGKTRDV
jgi:asparagine synthase (glutamine-hydrolysing)